MEKPKKCIYCGRDADTNDHIPPQSLFGKPRPSNLITVPSCKRCNNEYSKDDEYFRNMIVLNKEAFDHPDVQAIIPAVFRGLSRSEQIGLRMAFLDSIRDIDVQTEAGIYLGKKKSYSVEKSRVCRVAERIVKGLYWTNNNQPIPETWSIKSYLIEDTILQNRPAIEKIASWFAGLKGKQIGKGVFRYWLTEDTEKKAQVWWLTFYHVVDFMVIIVKN